MWQAGIEKVVRAQPLRLGLWNSTTKATYNFRIDLHLREHEVDMFLLT